MRGLSRREFFGGAAGIVAAAALPSSSSARAAIAQRSAPAATTALAGAVVNPGAYHLSSWVDAANTFDGYIGLPMATTIQKVYMGHGQFGTAPPFKMTQLASTGCQFLISIKPNKAMTTTEQTRISKWLTMLNNSGMSYRVVLYTECNNKAFRVEDEWLTYWSFYAPVIKDAGVVCAYNPGCGYPALPRAEAFFPSNPTPDELWMDYYATGFRAGGRLDQLISQAKDVGISAGMGEFGWSAGPVVFTPMVMPWWNEYCAYLTNLVQEGNLGLGAMYFGSQANGRNFNVISSADDPRIPGIQQVAQAIDAS